MILFDFDIQHRMDLQRKLLKLVNSKSNFNSQLNGLSNSAIDSWYKNNTNIDPELIKTLKNVSNTLLVLSTKSQESIDIQDLNLSELKDNLANLNKILINI